MGQVCRIDEVCVDSWRDRLFFYYFNERGHLCVLLPENVPSSSYFLPIHGNKFSAIKAAVKAEINSFDTAHGLSSLLLSCPVLL